MPGSIETRISVGASGCDALTKKQNHMTIARRMTVQLRVDG
jgi:hypothetical protein